MSDTYCRDCRACKYIDGKAWCACRAKDISDVDPKCDCFRRKRPTLFDRITASPEVLAEEFVEMMYDRVAGDYRYYSMLTGEFYNSREEAIAATVAKLKEVADAETR
jgi:hypothetical protein